MVAKGLKALEGFVKPDGGIYGDRLKNYETCVAIVAFKLANTDGRYDELLANADKYVRELQYGPARDKDPNRSLVRRRGLWRRRTARPVEHELLDRRLGGGRQRGGR